MMDIWMILGAAVLGGMLLFAALAALAAVMVWRAVRIEVLPCGAALRWCTQTYKEMKPTAGPVQWVAKAEPTAVPPPKMGFLDSIVHAYSCPCAHCESRRYHHRRGHEFLNSGLQLFKDTNGFYK